MTKKKKYIPGWRTRKASQDAKTLEKAKQILDAYYEAQEIRNREYEESVSKQVPAQNNTSNIDNNREESERTDSVVENSAPQPIPAQQQQVLSPVSYDTESSDPMAFKDAIIPSILDPNYNEWATRQAERANKTGDTGFVSQTAKAAVNLLKSYEEDENVRKEAVYNRMNRRIMENNAFGMINKNKALTYEEAQEIDNYRLLTDPYYASERLEQLHKEVEELEKRERGELESVEEPDLYTGRSIRGEVGAGGTMTMAQKLINLAKSAWGKSFLSDFIEETNASQMKVSIGQIQRSKELVDLSDMTQLNIDLIELYANNLAQLKRFNDQQTTYMNSIEGDGRRVAIATNTPLAGLSPAQRQMYAKLIDSNREIRQKLAESDWWKTANNLASWAPKSIGGLFAGAIDKAIDDDIGGIRNNLYGLGGELDDLTVLMNSRVNDQKWLDSVVKKTGKIKQILGKFNSAASERQDRWRQQALTDAQDIADWRSGNNWLKFHAEVDPYYKALKKLLENSEFDWSDPVKMAQFGWSGVAGGSNSSWWKSIISIASKGIGAIGGAITTGGTSALILTGAIAASFESDKSAGSDENNIESEDKTASALRSKLIASGKYNDFIDEGLLQLENTLTNKGIDEYLYTTADGKLRSGRNRYYDKDVIQQVLNSSKDDEKLEDFIMDMYLSGAWHSSDPKITKFHADAVIGTNNQFYNNQPVNTADAAIGSIVDIANLEPVKYLARASKVIGKSRLGYLKNTSLGKNLGLKYTGFKEGIHNARNVVADSWIGKAVENGTIKTLDAAAKVPTGAYVGSLVGAETGYYSSEGSTLGAVAGAVAGAGAGYLLHKTPKFLGIEDKIAKAYLTTRAFATRVPKVWMDAAAIGKGVANISTRYALDTGSEMLQEGVQALNARDEQDYDVLYNRPLWNRVLDDMMLGARAAYIWLNQDDPEMKSESDVYSQMNATPLLTLFGPTNIQAITQANNMIDEMNTINIVANNIDAARRGDIAELELGRQYASRITKEDRDEMRKKFEQFRRIAGSHTDAVQQLNPTASTDALMERDSKFIPNELIDEQEKDYEDIYTLANSKRMYAFAANAGIKPGSDRYAQLVSMESFRHKKRTEAAERLKEKDQENAYILGQDALEGYISWHEAAEERSRANGNFEEDYNFAENPDTQTFRESTIEKNDLAKMLVHAATIMQIVDDYSQLQKLSGREDSFLNWSKARLNSIKKELKNHGIDVETIDDVNTELNLSEEGNIIRTLIERSRSIDNQTSLSMSDYVDAYMEMLRERELLEYDFLIQDKMLKEFRRNPNAYLDRWNQRLKSDEQLEAILESDWVNTIRDYMSASAREIKDNDIYAGYDGWYITKKVGDKFEKHRWHKNGTIDKEALPFDPVEYDQAKKTQEEAIRTRKISERVNRNIQTGSPEGPQVQEESEQGEQETPAELEVLPEEEQATLQIGDFVTSGDGVGKIIGVDDDGHYVVSYGTGRPQAVVPSNLLQKVTTPIAESEYDQGDIIEAGDGTKYTVAEVTLESIDNDTHAPKYTYTLINIDSNEELHDKTKEDIAALTKSTKNEAKVKPNKAQREVIQILSDKKKNDKKNTELANGTKRRTGHDYFIKVKGKLQRFVRVHGILDNLFEESEEEKTLRARYINELTQLYNKSKTEFIDRVNLLQNEYNDKVARKYGKDTDEYTYYAIDLSFYLRGNILNDEGIIEAIASILSSEQPGPAVVRGSIIDEIARDFFDPTVEVVNKKSYRMSDATFNSIINLLNELQERFDKLGWVVDTTAYTWYGQFANGERIAGETDMIAIDKQGHIHILDFKTTADLTKFDTVLEYKTKDLQGNDVWMPIDKEHVPEGAETRVSSDFFTKLATKDVQTGKRTYAAQYARQLEVYRQLIQQYTGKKVTSTEIIPFAVQEDISGGTLKKIKAVSVYDPINLSKVPSLKEEISDIDNYLNSSGEAITLEEIASIVEQIEDKLSDINAKLEIDGVGVDTRNKLQELFNELSALQYELEKLTNNKIKLSDSVFVDGLLSNRDSSFRELDFWMKRADDEITEYKKEQEGSRPKKEGPEIDAERSWILTEPEEIVEDDRKHWWQFNNLHSLSSKVKNMPGYLRSIIKSDFLKNATFIISKDKDDERFSVTIKYRRFTFSDIYIRLGNEAPVDLRNEDIVPDKFLSAMSRSFLRQYYQLAKNLKPGERIIATKVERTNGTIRYSGNNKNLQSSQFLGKNDPRLLRLINDEDSLVGVSADGVVVEVGSGNRQPIWSPKTDLDGQLVAKKIRERVLPGNVDSDSIPDGVVIFLHKFKYEEDPEDADFRKIPIVLQGRYLDGKWGQLICSILVDTANSKTPNKTLTDLFKVKVIEKDGTTRYTTVPGLTNQKVLKLLTRFGGQAEMSGDEFVFNYATTAEGKPVAGHKIIRITDMLANATVDRNGNLHRPTVDLDLRKEEDVLRLQQILAKTQMHINQMGFMRSRLNTDELENSMFGALRTFFMDPANQNVKTIQILKDLQIDEEDVFADENDPSIGLTGIGWAIKHGYAGTNAVELENPLISIHELGVENVEQKKSAEKKLEVIDKKINDPETDEEKPKVDVSLDQQPAVIQKPEDDNPEEELAKKDDRKKRLEHIRMMLDEVDDDDFNLSGFGRLTAKRLRKSPISQEEKDKIEKRLRRLVGRVAIKWTEGAIEVLKSGAQVAGRTAVSAIELSDRLIQGTEFHEAFHRILEILIPNARRQKIYDAYREKYGKSFKDDYGRELTDRDISEQLAEMFRMWMLNKQEIKLHWNILKTFREIRDYIDQLKSLGDRRFASLFVLANSGIFRFIKPDAKNVEHFKNVLGGMSDLRISAKNADGKLEYINLDMFPGFGGRALFNDAIDGIIYALFHGYSIDMLATNAARLSTNREDVANLFRGGEKTKHSAWFRVLTGEYVDSEEEFNEYDAITYYKAYRRSSIIEDIALDIQERNPEITGKELKVEIIAAILEQEREKKEEDLELNQKMMRQLFSEDTWWAIEKKINNKLHTMSIDSERVTEEDYVNKMDTADDDQDDPNIISKDAGDHKDEFYDHSRTEDATAAVRFFLSSIPDERFATEEDVEKGIVKKTRDKNGPVMISNSTNLLGYQQFLSMKIVSNRLLLACHNVSTVEELDKKLQALSDTDPIFYRIAKKYHNALENEILKTPSGKKNRILYKGKQVSEEMYEQGKDELGWYYVWTDAGENPGERIDGAVTQTNPDMESFVTQLFNYVSCQKLDFIMVNLQQEVDDDGEVIDGKYTAKVRSTDSDYAASVYPRSWFIRLRSGVTGIFKITNKGKYTFTTDGQNLFYDAISTLNLILAAFTGTGNIKIHERILDKNNEEDFRAIEREFITSLNTLGINITREALEYYLLEDFGQDISIRKAFGLLISKADKETSFKKFIEALRYLKDGVTKSGKNEILTKNQEEGTIGYGRFAQDVKRSGVYIYSSNGFVNWLSRAVSRYNKTASEIMTNGPEGTQRYMFAQSNTASDITDNFNKAVVVDGEIQNSWMLSDMKRYIYNSIKGVRGIPKGSIIIKQIFFNSDKKLHLVLHTHGGVKVDNDYSGGVSYKKITEREDWLSKVAILKEGGILFPTLSDKSTWYYLTGVRVPGIDYSSLSKMSTKNLPRIGLHTKENPTSQDAHILFDFSIPNAQLDLMIEYAECERSLVEREINRGKKGSIWENLKVLPKIEFFDENRKRFGGLCEIVDIDKQGKPDLVVINDYSKTPEDCLKLADDVFFSKSPADKRRIMALTLEQGFLRNLELAERTGLIVASNNLEEKVLTKNGKDTGKVRPQNRLMQYKNVGLDSEVIDRLKEIYLSEILLPKNTNYSLEQSRRAESQAICAFIWDIYMRGIISNEETERMYIGAPQFFKWKHDTFKDAISGKVINALTDRHSDQSKRLGGFGSTGDKNRTDLANQKRTYRCAEVEDLIVKSKLYDETVESFKDNYIRDTYILYKERQIEADNSLSEEEKIEALDKLNDSVYGEDKLDLSKIEEELKSTKEGNIAYEIAIKNAKDDSDSFSGDINVTDGAAYIRPEMAKALLRQRGRYTSKVAEAFDILEGNTRSIQLTLQDEKQKELLLAYLKNNKIGNFTEKDNTFSIFVNKSKIGSVKKSLQAFGQVEDDTKRVNPLMNKKAYLIVYDALIGAQKYSAYGYRTSEATEDIPVHYYNKFALFPIFPQMATGFMSDILKKMEFQKIDMLMMHSAVKTGSQEPIKCESEMFENAEAFEKFRFNTYDQDFVFIRRQLNTDPHERKTIQMGTQTSKVALANLRKNRKYTREDGSVIRGRDLLDSIMTSINALSDIGKSKIEKEFFTNGELDIDKFSHFLEEQLDSRDADENLLDGIEVEFGPDGKHFKVPLEAMSSVDWIQSILVSKINKDVIDINMKGNALYQRSVWGMEGHPKVLDDKKVNFKLTNINDGNDLQFINEDGSMDAVVSIDFFEDVIPKSIRGNFNKSRQWLIDHDIISGIKSDGTRNEAKANTIASRIPTQAQSSIHALRFVDVLPIVRDTIILPKEFTKITGSDFDIDKLYLVRLGYRVNTKKVESSRVDTVSTEFDEEKDRENYYRNKLIKDYLVLLKSHGKRNLVGAFENGDSIHISVRSIDKDTDLVKGVLKRIAEGRPQERYYAYKFGNIAFQVMTKTAFMLGKFGIGPFALNNNNQILTQLYGIKFAKDTTHTNILDALGCLDLSNRVDKQHNMVLSWLSALINAHVDVAKDPYIAQANINTFTYNLTNLLIRTGMGERTILFTAQPIMVELARVYNDASGSYMVDSNKSKSARQREATRNFVIDAYKRGSSSSNGDIKFIDEMLMGPKNSDEDNCAVEEMLGSYARAIFGIDSDGNYEESFDYIDPSTGEVVPRKGCILEDILTNPEALKSNKKGFTFDNVQDNRPLYRVYVKNKKGETEEVYMSPKDVQEYVYFIQNALAKYGQKLSDLVNACKIDTKKQGKSYVEQQSYLEKYNSVFDNEDGMFEQLGLDDLKNKSYVGKKTENATSLYERILSSFSILATATFKVAHDKILQKLNSSAQNQQLSKKVSIAIMTWLKSKFFEEYVGQHGNDYFASLFYGENSILSRLLKIQNLILRDRSGKFSKFGKNGDITLGENGTITNPLLKALQPDVYEEKDGFEYPLFVKLENALLDDSNNANAIERAWDELFRDEYHYEEDEQGVKHYYIKEFAQDLAVYAFLTSGDRTGTTKFFRYVPNPIRRSLLIETGLGVLQSYAQYMGNLQKEFSDGTFDISDRDIDEIIGQNWYDNDFVKEVKMSIRRKGGRTALRTSFGTISTKSQLIVPYKKGYGKIGYTTETIIKVFNWFIAGFKKVLTGIEETIHRSNDELYPPYIKVRRPSSTKYDSDNFVLYKFREAMQIDPTDESKGTYPIYEIVNPTVASLRAGSYDYVLYDYGENSAAYPIGLQDILREVNETELTDETSKDKALLQFAQALNDLGVSLEEPMISELLLSEYNSRGFLVNDSQLNAAVKWVKSKLTQSKEGGKTSGKKAKAKKSTKTKTKTSSLKETVYNENGGQFTESKGSYQTRTDENAEWSDITLAFATDFTTAGELRTAEAAGAKVDRKAKTIKPAGKYQPVKLHIGTPEDPEELVLAYDELDKVVKAARKVGKPIKLNIAGNGLYSIKSSQEQVNIAIQDAIKYLQLGGVEIAEIRSGGQTGVDEAGIIAAQRLGIKWSVHAPKGWKFRDANGDDISDKDAFISRFVLNGSTTSDQDDAESTELDNASVAGNTSNRVASILNEDMFDDEDADNIVDRPSRVEAEDADEEVKETGKKALVDESIFDDDEDINLKTYNDPKEFLSKYKDNCKHQND